MRRVLLMLPVLALAACSRFEGPREVYQKNRSGDRADLPGYTISEQQQRGRERLTTIDDDARLAPKTGADRPGGIGR